VVFLCGLCVLFFFFGVLFLCSPPLFLWLVGRTGWGKKGSAERGDEGGVFGWGRGWGGGGEALEKGGGGGGGGGDKGDSR